MLSTFSSCTPTLIMIFAAVILRDRNAGCFNKSRIAAAAADFMLDPVPRPVAYILEDGNSGNDPSRVTTFSFFSILIVYHARFAFVKPYFSPLLSVVWRCPMTTHSCIVA
jgi:hypothetical protein